MTSETKREAASNGVRAVRANDVIKIKLSTDFIINVPAAEAEDVAKVLLALSGDAPSDLIYSLNNQPYDDMYAHRASDKHSPEDN